MKISINGFPILVLAIVVSAGYMFMHIGEAPAQAKPDELKIDEQKIDEQKIDQQNVDVAAAKPQPKLAVVIPFQGAIDAGLEQFFERKLNEAQTAGADVIVLEIDSPGGNLRESQNIAVRLQHLDWAKTIAYIPHQALSGAAIVSLGCDEILLGPEGRLGDAGPIYRDEFAMFQHADEKIRSVLVADIRAQASAHHRPAAICEAMVDRTAVVIKVRDKATGKELFVTQREFDSPPKGGEYEKIEVVDETNRGLFLTVHGARAVELNVADAVVADGKALEERIGAATFKRIRASTTDIAVDVLTHPLVTALLILIGFVALVWELLCPGVGLGGALSALCFGLFFWSRFLGGTTGTFEVVLFLAGVIFLALELFVIPGFGIAGICGIVLICVSLVLASVEFVLPRTNSELTQLATQLLIFLGALVAAVIALAITFRQIESIPLFRRLVLQPPGDEYEAPEHKSKPSAAVSTLGEDILVGSWGTTTSPLRPMGKARFEGRLVDVASEGDFIDPNVQVRVVEIQGNRVIVRPV
jgi:membrane-bound serine protease (ClpP class)